MATLSNTDKANLNAEQQKQVQALKKQWVAAATQAEKDAIHAQAEEIRKNAASGGYTAGASGTGYQKLDANSGGMTADQMGKWLEDYNAANYRAGSGWTNGYSTAMNVRAKANQVRQQMQANEQAGANASEADRQYLHEQNLALAKLLDQYTGAGPDTTYYNEAAKRWETWNPDVGYGYNMQFTQPNIYNDHKNFYGYTDADIAKYSNDPSLYYNFVDPNTNRLAIDESSGYTGKYSQFVNGPYAQLLSGGTHNGAVNPAVYMDLYGDGFGKEGPTGRFTPIRDENGNVLNAEAPALKNNNAMSDYTNQFTSYVSNGVIQPGLLVGQNPGANGDAGGAYSYKTGYGADASDPRYTGGVDRDVIASTAADPNNLAGQMAYFYNYAKNATDPRVYGSLGSIGGAGGSGGSGAGDYGSYLEQMYAAALEAQLNQLKASYDQNISDLNAEKGTVDDTYTEQKRQTTGTNAQEAANWREMANAYGLNSGAVGQAALAQSNQLQSNLNTLESAQAAAQAEIERQRTLMGQQYQLQINQALAENNYQKAQALYQEAVRQDEALRQQEQFNAQMALQYAQLAQQQSQFDAEMALNYAKAAAASGSGGSGGGIGSVSVSPEYTMNDMFIAAMESPEGAAAWLSSKPNRKAYGYGDYSVDKLMDTYNNWVAGLSHRNSGLGLSELRNIVSSSPTYSAVDKAKLALQYNERGALTDDELAAYLSEIGVPLEAIMG